MMAPTSSIKIQHDLEGGCPTHSGPTCRPKDELRWAVFHQQGYIARVAG